MLAGGMDGETYLCIESTETLKTVAHSQGGPDGRHYKGPSARAEQMAEGQDGPLLLARPWSSPEFEALVGGNPRDPDRAVAQRGELHFEWLLATRRSNQPLTPSFRI